MKFLQIVNVTFFFLNRRIPGFIMNGLDLIYKADILEITNK